MDYKRGSAETGYLDVLRVYSCLAIVFFHTFAHMIIPYGSFLTETELYFSVVLQNSVNFCLTCFVMISGFLFLYKDIPIKKIFTKYILRMALALIAFGVPFAFMEVFYNAHYQFSADQIKTVLLNVYQGKMWAHMWYLYMVIGLYLLVPLFRVFAKYADKKTMEYILIVLFIFTSVIPTLQSIIPYELGLNIPIPSIFVFYFFLGYYLQQYNIRINNKIIYSGMAFYILYMILICLNKKLYNARGDIIGLDSFISPLIVMYSIMFFCFFRQNVSFKKIYAFLSPLTFGVYLMHPFFLNLLFKVFKFTPENYPLAVVIVFSLLIAVVSSALFTFVARKIKVVRDYIL